MNELMEKIAQEAFYDELEKMGVSIDSLEGNLEGYLSDEQEDVARRLIKEEESKSFSLRHPWLTGIPTLGIAPAIANSVANQNIIRKMSKSDPVVRALLTAVKQRSHELSVAEASAPNISTNVYSNSSEER